MEVDQVTTNAKSINKKRDIWKVEEDNALISLIELYGTEDWSFISKRMPKRSNKQCHNRWTYILNINMKKDEWTETEDDTINRLYCKYGKQWTKVKLWLKY